MDYAEAHNMHISGHTLIWGLYLPDWITDPATAWTTGPTGTLATEMKNHITTVIEHMDDYSGGNVQAWDVVNEAFCGVVNGTTCIGTTGEGGMSNTIWYDIIGPTYIEIALQAARDANATVYLYINDNTIELASGDKAIKVHDFVSQLVDDSIPIDGVGSQMHINLDDVRTIGLATVLADMEDVFDALDLIGLDLRVTEIDVRIKDTDYDTPAEIIAADDDQADVFGGIMELCVAASNCDSFVMWGFTDKYSWIPDFSPGYDHAHPVDDTYDPKPAYTAIVEALDPPP